MGGVVDELFAVEGFEVVNHVVDHIVAVNDGFAAAEDELLPFEEREVLSQPGEFFGE